MALKRLTAEEMVQLSTPWVSEGNAARAAIEKYPVLKALLPQLEAAHAGIFGVQRPPDDPAGQRLSDEEAALDATHDALVRGIHGTLSLLAEFSAAADELLRLRDILLPEGLEHTRKTYRGEAGHAALVAARLDSALRDRMGKVQLHDRTLLELVDAWLAAAAQLGAREDERARLAPPVRTSSLQANGARLAWVRVVNALVANAELAEIDDASKHLLFSALRIAERTADGRARRTPPQQTVPTPTPTPRPAA